MQHLTFCCVGDHQQNGIYELIIKYLALYLQTLVLHAEIYYPEYITVILWTFVLVASADRMNNLHVEMNGKTPEMKFQTQLDQLLG